MTGTYERPKVVPKLRAQRDEDLLPDRATNSADLRVGVVPDHRVSPTVKTRAADPAGVLQKIVPRAPTPRGPIDEGAILVLAVKVLSARINQGQSNAK
jgi:hypothetical protein